MILMRSAVYGRMHIGRCVDKDFGHLGCSADVLQNLDQTCSGLNSCQVSVVSIEAELNCRVSRSLARYLEAKYTCTKGKTVIFGSG